MILRNWYRILNRSRIKELLIKQNTYLGKLEQKRS
jgi:hypothetical protein